MSSDGAARKTKRWGRLCGCLGTTDEPTIPAKQVSYLLPLSYLPRRLADITCTPEKVSYTQSAKGSESNYELWDRALRQLRKSKADRDIVAVIEEIVKNPAGNNEITEGGPGTVKGFAKDIKEKMELQIKGQGENSDTNRFVQKTVSVLNRFISVGDVAVNFDPVHAALPWAAVRFVLVVSSS